MSKVILITCTFLLISFSANARDSLFHGVWASEQRAFRAIWGNFLIDEKTIYWGRLDNKLWRSDIENYACSAEYEIVKRGKEKSYPNINNNLIGLGYTYIYVRYKLKNKRCEYSQIINASKSKKLEYLQLSTGYNGVYGGNAQFYAYDADKKLFGGGLAFKIKHLSK
jgi:hypothetical protein